MSHKEYPTEIMQKIARLAETPDDLLPCFSLTDQVVIKTVKVLIKEYKPKDQVKR